MADSTKLVSFFQKIDPKVLESWKETINHTETIKKRLEESLEDNTKKHKNE